MYTLVIYLTLTHYVFTFNYIIYHKFRSQAEAKISCLAILFSISPAVSVAFKSNL